MKLPKELLTQVPNWDLLTLYKNCRALGVPQKLLDQARFGIKVHFDIHDIFDGNVKTWARSNWVSIAGKQMQLDAYRTELETRENLLRTEVYKCFETEDIIEEG